MHAAHMFRNRKAKGLKWIATTVHAPQGLTDWLTVELLTEPV